MRPRYEGSNICSWIGFKHVMYLMEEALLDKLLRLGFGKGKLFEENSLCLELVSSSVRILHAFHMDDLAQIEITFNEKGAPLLECAVRIFLQRGEKRVKAASGTVKVTVRQYHEKSGATRHHEVLAPFVVPDIPVAPSPLPRGTTPSRGAKVEHPVLMARHRNNTLQTYIWEWHVPYFYCHFTNRIQNSGYLRLMEEVVDLFLADRGMSIRTMLENKNWIPVVPNASVEILEDAFMEEKIFTVYSVKEIFKNFVYTAGFDCYVERGNELVHTATGSITHGYAVIDNRQNWTLVNLDEETIDALRGKEKELVA